MENKNNTWAIVIGVLLVVLVLFLVFKGKKSADNAMMESDESATAGEMMSGDTGKDMSDGTTTTGKPAVTVSYQDALVKYASSRIQFDVACQMIPAQVTYKDGTMMMLDNRSSEERTIHLGSMGDYVVKGYGFKVVQLSRTGLSTNDIAVDCGSQENVGLIKVQK